LAKAAATSAPPGWQSPQPRLAGRRLLIAEDNAFNQRVVQHCAEQWGLTVELASSSREVFNLLAHRTPFDAAILDLQLPDMDGLALAAEIRGQPDSRFLPLVLLSSVRLRSDD